MTEAKCRHKIAVGLVYDSQTADAPSVGVKGAELLADEVVRLARRFGVPVVERPALARGLSGLEIDEPIPEELYQAAALVLTELEQNGRRSPDD